MGIELALQEDGTVEVRDEFGNDLPPKIVRLMKEQKGDFIQNWLQERCEHWNQGIERILNIHIDTPTPDPPRGSVHVEFDEPTPLAPDLKKIGFIDGLIRNRREAIEDENRRAIQRHRELIEEWQLRKQKHAQAEQERRELHQKAVSGNTTAMTGYLSDVLEHLEWPRETTIDFEVSDGGGTVLLDVDLPEIEDIPAQQAAVAGRGLKINVRDRSDTQRRKDYMVHSHAVLFRLIGEVFHSLPKVETVVASGYSQRLDKRTGHLSDDYLISAIVKRSRWNEINFGALANLDLPRCFELFDLRRKMTKTGVFTAIDPHG